MYRFGNIGAGTLLLAVVAASLSAAAGALLGGRIDHQVAQDPGAGARDGPPASHQHGCNGRAQTAEERGGYRVKYAYMDRSCHPRTGAYPGEPIRVDPWLRQIHF